MPDLLLRRFKENDVDPKDNGLINLKLRMPRLPLKEKKKKKKGKKKGKKKK